MYKRGTELIRQFSDLLKWHQSWGMPHPGMKENINWKHTSVSELLEVSRYTLTKFGH